MNVNESLWYEDTNTYHVFHVLVVSMIRCHSTIRERPVSGFALCFSKQYVQ